MDAPPIVNEMEAGLAVPVIFRLGGNRGLAVFASGWPRSAPITCPPKAVKRDDVEITFKRATNPAWAGTCRELTLRFNDGTVRRTRYEFKRP